MVGRHSSDARSAQRAGRLHRNFQGYTSDNVDALIGLGPSAIGRLPQGYVQNAPDVGGYSRAVEAGKLATASGIAVTRDDLLRSCIIERPMCDLDAFVHNALGALAAEGMVRIEGSRITVTEPSRLFVRLVAAASDAYLLQNRARHSIAV
jgi:oxygen-independent coproporphyrinogen III oxidase